MDWLPRPPRSTEAAGPLAGVRVLDFTELLPGPFLTQNLAEMGADVLKVERPPRGDPVRHGSPALFHAVNHGKRSVTADLKSTEGRAAVLALVAQADVVVEAFRPGVMQRLGCGYEQLRAVRPDLVYVSLTGYGAVGPHASWPGHDINYLAAAGVADLAMPDGGGSPRLGVAMADLTGSVYALACVNAALLQRARTGAGQWLDVALTDCVMHWASIRLATLPPTPAGRRPAPRSLAAYGVFTCRDGMQLSLAALEDHFWASLVGVLGLAPFGGPEHARRAARDARAHEINAVIAATLARLDGARALHDLVAADVPVFELVAARSLATSPQARARGLFGADATCRFPVRMAGMSPATAPPEEGDNA